jgi:hypothetical protein
MKPQLATLCAIAFAGPASATDVQELLRDGYAVWSQTSVQGEFHGCVRGRYISFHETLGFECREDRHNYANNPSAVILRHADTGDLRVFIDNVEYEGVVVVRTMRVPPPPGQRG